MKYYEGLLVVSRNEELKNPLIDIWHNQVYKRNENVIVAVMGKTGSGKSYTALSLASQFPEFEPENIVFTSKDFFALVNSGKLKKGSVIVYDEAEVDLDNLTFWDKLSRFFSYMMATIRYRNYIIIFTMPFKSDIISKVRRLIHWNIECTNIKNVKEKYTYVKIYMNSPNYRTGEIYDKFLRISYKGQIHLLKSLKVKMPPKNLIEYYEAQKHPYITKLYKDFEEQMDQESTNIKRPLTDQQELVYYAYLKYKPSTQEEWANKIIENMGVTITRRSVGAAKKLILKKGYSFTDKTPEQLEQIEKRALRALERLQESDGLFVKEEKEEKKGDKE